MKNKENSRFTLERVAKKSIASFIVIALILSMSGCSNADIGTDSSADEAAVSESGIADTSEAEAVVNSDLTFSQPSGLYESEFQLSISTGIEGGTIRYTLDGSDPTIESPTHTEELSIEDRTSEENLLSAIISSGSGGFAGGQANGEMPEGFTPPTDGEMPEGFTPPTDGEMPEGFTPPTDAEMPEGFTSPTDGEMPEGGLDTETETPTEGENAGKRSGVGKGGSAAATAPEENVFKGTVIKAAVYSETGEMLSDIFTNSYFVSEDIFTRYADLPIVSIVTDADNFYDEETGIYVNSEETGSEWERPVYFEMFESDGTSVISQGMGVRINGGTTTSIAQKALRFYAKSEYDEENTAIEYELFDGLTKSNSEDILETFKRLILRSSGNDNSSTLFRDSLMQELVNDLNVNTQASRPSIAFVNGEFWGIYNIRERYDDNYFASHYDIDKSKVAVLEIAQGNSTAEISEGDETDLEFYNEMWDFFNANSLTNNENYLKAQEYLDVDNFIDYYIANIYSGNTDWPANNNVFWRYKTDNGGYDDTAEYYMDGRFRWVIKDMDWGFGLMGEVSGDTLSHALNENSSTTGNRGGGGGGFTSSESTLMFRKLIENTEFAEKFVNRFCDVMNTNYETESVIASINSMKEAIEPAIEEQSNRYKSSVSSVSSWEENIEKMIDFVKERAGYVKSQLASKFSLSEVIKVTLTTNNDYGYIRINDTNINTDTKGVTDGKSWTGSYFAGTTQTLKAVPIEGKSFVKFVVTDIETSTVTEQSLDVIDVVVGKEGTTVQAVFE